MKLFDYKKENNDEVFLPRDILNCRFKVGFIKIAFILSYYFLLVYETY